VVNDEAGWQEAGLAPPRVIPDAPVARMQAELLQLLPAAAAAGLPQTPLRQLILALAHTSIPLLSRLSRHMLPLLIARCPPRITLMALQTLAEEVASLEPFGQGGRSQPPLWLDRFADSFLAVHP
jgi:hypothetical protein